MDYLPIFVDVRDRLVVVIGGGVVAHRKTEHLLKAHARVRVVAPELSADLAAYRDLGRVEHRPLLFSASQLEGAALVVAATDDDAVNEAVSTAPWPPACWPAMALVPTRLRSARWMRRARRPASHAARSISSAQGLGIRI